MESPALDAVELIALRELLATVKLIHVLIDRFADADANPDLLEIELMNLYREQQPILVSLDVIRVHRERLERGNTGSSRAVLPASSSWRIAVLQARPPCGNTVRMKNIESPSGRGTGQNTDGRQGAVFTMRMTHEERTELQAIASSMAEELREERIRIGRSGYYWSGVIPLGPFMIWATKKYGEIVFAQRTAKKSAATKTPAKKAAAAKPAPRFKLKTKAPAKKAAAKVKGKVRK